MPGLPAEGGWGSSNRTLGIEMEGFSVEEIAKAVDFCDNDKIKTVKYLQKLKAKGGGHNWKDQLQKKLPTLDNSIKNLCQRLLEYDNVPAKQKTFVNFCKNSLALMRQPHLAEKMWEACQDCFKKPAAPAAAAPKAEEENPAEEQNAEDEDEEDSAERKRLKKEKKAAKKAAKEAAARESEQAQEEEEEEEDEAERKRRKKEKKAAKKAAKEAAAREAELQAERETEEAEQAESKKDKKKKKKAPVEEEEDDNMEVEVESDKKKMKKEKKRKEREQEVEEDDAPEPTPKSKKGAKNQFNFYKEKADVASMSAAEVQKYRKSVDVKLENCSLNPITKFENAPMSAELMQCCKTFEKPSPIQASAWPICLSGQDIIAIASTGSGKTLGFGLPGITHIVEQNLHKARQTSMLVLLPTRELAMQVATVLQESGKPCGLKTVCLYGGVSKGEQKALLRGGAQIVVATPGRLLDLIQEGVMDCSKVTYLVLDEADRMLDQGFEKEVRSIIKSCNPARQTVMFSATWPTSIQELAAEFLKNPAKITVGSEELAANHRVKQTVEVLDPQVKDRRLVELLKKYHTGKNRTIIFVLYKKEAERVFNMVESKGFNATAIHGDRSQDVRSKAMDNFRQGKVPVLIATDVAARGLDIPDVEYVINYTFPLTTEDYVHRIGRTGRAGKEGSSHTLFTLHDKARAGELVNVLREANQPVPEELLKFGTHVKKKESKLYGAHFKEVDMSQKATKKTFDDSDDE